MSSPTERRREQSLAYYYRNREAIAERRKARVAANPEAERKRQRTQYALHRDRILAAKKKHRDANRGAYSAKAKAKRAQQVEPPHDYLRRGYGLTIEDYQRMLAEQGGGCAICTKPDNGRRLAVDHCHVTGKVRGLLCQKCNTAIGKLGEDPDRIDKAAAYLRRHRV